MLKEGYESVIYSRIFFLCPSNNRTLQAGPGLFKVATFSRWMVLPTNSELVEDIRKAPEDILSIREPIDEVRAQLLVG